MKKDIKQEEGVLKSDVAMKRPRKKLTEVGGPLRCKPIDGYHLRWVAINNPHDPMSMNWAMDRGYEMVAPEEQDIYSYERSSDPTHRGSDIRRTGRDGISLVLMKLPKELHDEDIEDFKKTNNAAVEAKTRPTAPEAIGSFGTITIDK